MAKVFDSSGNIIEIPDSKPSGVKVGKPVVKSFSYNKSGPSISGQFEDPIDQAKKAEELKKLKRDAAKDKYLDPNDPKRNLDKAKFQLIQSGILYHQMQNWNKQKFPGIEKLPTRIPMGVANWWYGEKTGQNPYVEPFKGDQVETAASLMKIAAPSARGGERMIEMFQQTLPSIWATPEEAKGQLLSSMSNSVYNLISADPEGFEEWVSAQEDAARAGADPHLYMATKIRKNLEPVIDELFNARKTVPSHAIVNDGILMRSEGGEIELVPLKNYADARMDGYLEIGKQEADKWRQKVNTGR